MTYATISGADAKAQGLTRYFTGKACPKGHVCERFVSAHTCVDCIKAGNKFRAWNTEAGIAYRKQRKKLWLLTPGGKAHKKRNTAKHFKTESGRRTVYRNKLKHTARKIAACPPWVSPDAIYAVYQGCPEGFHVDHIVPLKGITIDGFPVSGLHLPVNLQYLPALENVTKRNRMRPFEQAMCEGKILCAA